MGKRRRVGRGADHTLLLDSVAVEHVVEGSDVDTAVGDGETAPMIPGRDVVAAVPEFLAGLGVERIENGLGGTGDASRGDVVKTDVWVGLIGVLTIAVGEYHSVGDDRRFGAVHVARNPGG